MALAHETREMAEQSAAVVSSASRTSPRDIVRATLKYATNHVIQHIPSFTVR